MEKEKEANIEECHKIKIIEEDDKIIQQKKTNIVQIILQRQRQRQRQRQTSKSKHSKSKSKKKKRETLEPVLSTRETLEPYLSTSEKLEPSLTTIPGAIPKHSKDLLQLYKDFIKDILIPKQTKHKSSKTTLAEIICSIYLIKIKMEILHLNIIFMILSNRNFGKGLNMILNCPN